MKTLVMKFGGTSVGSFEALQQVIEIIRRERAAWENLVVITSAMGGVTNKLVEMIDHALTANFDAIDHQISALRRRHRELFHHFIDPTVFHHEMTALDAHLDSHFEELRGHCHVLARVGSADAAARDAVMSFGERLMTPILAAILRANQVSAQAISAADIIVTDARHQNAQPLFEPSRVNARQKLLPLFGSGYVPVVTGYIGATAEGVITTLGRGGSDYSAAYVAGLIDADEVWIWTDVDGVMSADPRQIKNAAVIENLSYEQVSEFAYFGAKVLHPRTMEPLTGPQIPLYVRNTFNHTYRGTRVGNTNMTGIRHLSAVTAINGILVFLPSLSGDMVSEAPSLQNITRQVLGDMMLQEATPVITVDSYAGLLVCYVVPTTARRTAQQESIAALKDAFGIHYPAIAESCRVEPVSIVAAIGVVDIKQTMQVLNAVKAVRANLLAMGHGSPECSLLVVPPHESLRVLKRLHSMAIAVQSHLPYAENDPGVMPAPAIPSIPLGRKRRARAGGKNKPPQRTIPL